MRILAVDDDPVILDLLKGSLTTCKGYELTCAASAEEAVQVIQKDPALFDCFLLDIMLPGDDGIKLCGDIRAEQEYRSTPILMITASREPGLMGRAFKAGATDFISKPLDGIELGARINSAGLLNESLLRERQAQHTLAELTAQMQIQFEDIITPAAKGVTDLAALENDLLRMPSGVYAMNLLSIDVMGLRGVLRTKGPRAFRYHLEQVAEAASEAQAGLNWKMAYVGSGRFLAVVMDRKRLNHAQLEARITDVLERDWNEDHCGVPVVPVLALAPLTDQRLWTGLSASNMLRDHCHSTDLFEDVSAERDIALFEGI